MAPGILVSTASSNGLVPNRHQAIAPANDDLLYPQLQQSSKGGSKLVSPCPSVCPSVWRIIYGHKLPYMKKTRKKKQVCGAACFMAAEIKFSKDVRGRNLVCSVFSAILAGSISCLYGLSSNFRRCVVWKVHCKIFQICNFDFVLFWLWIQYESIVWVIMRQHGVSSECRRSSSSYDYDKNFVFWFFMTSVNPAFNYKVLRLHLWNMAVQSTSYKRTIDTIVFYILSAGDLSGVETASGWQVGSRG